MVGSGLSRYCTLSLNVLAGVEPDKNPKGT